MNDRLLGLDEELPLFADLEAIVRRLDRFADPQRILEDHVLVRLRQSLFVIHVPAEALEERIDELLPDLRLVERAGLVVVEMARERLDELQDFLGGWHAEIMRRRMDEVEVRCGFLRAAWLIPAVLLSNLGGDELRRSLPLPFDFPPSACDAPFVRTFRFAFPTVGLSMNDEVPNAIFRAAEARAQGHSWPAAAEQSGWELAGLRAWIRRNRSLWHRVLGQARSETHDAACDEAVTALRVQMRAKQPETVISAATALTARLAKPKSKPAVAAKKETDPTKQLDDWVESLPDKQLEKVGHYFEQLCEPNRPEGSDD